VGPFPSHEDDLLTVIDRQEMVITALDDLEGFHGLAFPGKNKKPPAAKGSF
jgi:hypothetical protein